MRLQARELTWSHVGMYYDATTLQLLLWARRCFVEKGKTLCQEAVNLKHRSKKTKKQNKGLFRKVSEWG